MDEWEKLLDTLCVDEVAPRIARSASEWCSIAARRPSWLLWGKATPTDSCPAHPLLLHMLDVAAVAGTLLQRTNAAVRNELLSLCSDERQAFRWFLFIVALHDFGKASPAFQKKAEWAPKELSAYGFDFDPPRSARHHGDLGFVFLSTTLIAHAVPAAHAHALARAVAAHHGQFPIDANITANQPGSQECGNDCWSKARAGIEKQLAAFFEIKDGEHVRCSRSLIVLLAGICAVADWIGSMQEFFVYEPPAEKLCHYWPRALRRARRALDAAGFPTVASSRDARSFTTLFPSYTPWPLHERADELAASITEPALVIVEAPMGEGKTEAALVLSEAFDASALSHGCYFGLPTQATANQMLGRVERFLRRTSPDGRSNLQLVHGEATLVDAYRKLLAVYDRGSSDAVGAQRWFVSKKRALLAEYGVGTIDQALLGVMLVRHLFVRLFGLASKTVIFDEVHAYDTYTSTIIERLLSWLAALRCPVVLLSATLPSERRAALVAAYQRGCDGALAAPPPASYPRITTTTRSRCEASSFNPRGASVSIRIETVDPSPVVIAQRLSDELTTRGGCIAYIANSVRRAQEVFAHIQAIDSAETLLIHARMLPDVRREREKQLEQWLGPEGPETHRPERCIVVGTQVLEQSLDVDFDLIVTDLAPIDLLLQRAGRLHRHKRSNRAATHALPRLLIARPEGPHATSPIDDVSKVYAEAIVRQTLSTLDGRETITLPDDIERLVESVYSLTVPAADDELFGAKIEYFGGRAAQRQDALTRLVPAPDASNDPFTSLRVEFEEEDDPAVHERLRAVTRSGPPSVELVCLVRKGGALFADDACTIPVDLAREPDARLVEALARRSIGVSTPGLVRFLVSSEREAASFAPERWSKSALLRYRRCAPFDDGVANVGDYRLELDDELGLTITRDAPR
ncbi:MAG: CRISPR-associated helicase Cas3' [Polyangiales bacterium]